MEISINNQCEQIPDQDNFTVQQLLQSNYSGKQQGIAVAINNHVIARALWEHTVIRDRDKVLIIKATQGG